jgi:zinc protease
MNLNSAKNIAETVGHYLQLTREPETVNRIYEQYEKVTAEDIMRVAKTYFTASNRSVVILTEGGK